MTMLSSEPCATVSLSVRRIPPKLRSLELRRGGANSGTAAPHLLALLRECALEDVWRLKCAEGLIPVSVWSLDIGEGRYSCVS